MNDSPDEELGEGAAMAGAGQDATGAELALAKEPDQVTTALAEISAKNTSITTLHAEALALGRRYQNVAFAVATTKGMDDARKARAEIRQKRFDIESLRDPGSKMLGAMQRQFNARARELMEEIERIETPIHEQITAQEQIKERERQEREEAEQRRRQAHIDAITAIARIPTEAVGMTSAELREKIVAAEGIMVDEGYEEFKGQATQAKDETIRQLNGLLMAAVEEEDELQRTREQQARLREQQEQQAARQRDLDAQEAALREQREAFEKQQQEAKEADEARQRALDEQAAQQRREREERAQAVQRRIDALSIYGAAYSSNAASVDIESALRTLNDTLLYAADYDARVSEAEQIKAARIASLRQILAEAIAREAEQARQQRAAEVQQRIDDIQRMGPRVDETGAELRARLDAINAFKLVAADYDDRADEAANLLIEVAADVAATLEEVAADELAQAQAAEERRQQEAEQAAARALVAAKQAHGEELYANLRRLVIFSTDMADDISEESQELAMSRDLLLQINPAETFEH